MAKNAFTDWSTTPSANTDIAGIGIQGTNFVSNFDDAFRTLMAQLRSGVDGKIVYATKSGAYTALLNDNSAYFRYTASATLSLTAAATLGANWHCFVYAYTGDVTVDPNASETINGATTLVIRAGEAMEIICDGTNFYGKLIPSFLFFYTTKSGNYTALYTDLNYTIRFTAAATLSLTAAATLGNAWRLQVMAYNGDVIIDPNGSETINGATTVTVRSGQTADIVCDGTGFYADIHGDGNNIKQQATVALSGTAYDITGIPSGVKRITLLLDGASISATAQPQIQLGSGSATTSGYVGDCFHVTATPTTVIGTLTSGHPLIAASVTATDINMGIIFYNVTGNKWIGEGSGRYGTTGGVAVNSSKVTLGGAIDRVRITTVAGTATLGGNATIYWEF